VGNSSARPAFVYDIETRTFTDITYPGAYLTAPNAINNAGTIAGFAWFFSGNYVSFEQVASGQQKTLTVPGASATYADGITDSGVVVGYYLTRSALLNFLYSRGKYRQLSIPHAPDAEVTGTNPSGTAFVGFYNAGGFLYQNKTLQTLQFPGAASTFAYGVNAAGKVSGIFHEANGNLHGFTWTPPGDAAKK
jgi:probable HAF family extracellular repeat protein